MYTKTLSVLSYLTICITIVPYDTKAPPSGSFMGRFRFPSQTLKTLTKQSCIQNLKVILWLVHEKKIFKDVPSFSPFWSLLGPLWVPAPILSQTLCGFTWGCYIPSLVKIGPLVLEKKSKMWKVNASRRTTDDDRQKTIAIGHLELCSGDLKRQ